MLYIATLTTVGAGVYMAGILQLVALYNDYGVYFQFSAGMH